MFGTLMLRLGALEVAAAGVFVPASMHLALGENCPQFQYLLPLQCCIEYLVVYDTPICSRGLSDESRRARSRVPEASMGFALSSSSNGGAVRSLMRLPKPCGCCTGALF